MNYLPYAHLAWKEYRAMRGFWLSIVVLVVLIEATIWTLYNTPASVVLLYSFGLAAPAFFAIGITGMAFSVEQEEGTFDFLRAAPVTAAQVLASKLGVASLATLAMFLVLWPTTLLFAHSAPTVLSGMLGLWLMAAVEAIVWGTLFSLLTARPLVAISLALAAASTVAHLLAWSVATGRLYEFEYAPYLTAVPWRALVAGAVLAADIYLGLNWLGGTINEKAKLTFRRKDKMLVQDLPAERTIEKTLLARSDRGAMIGHLLWQHLRQAGWLMGLMACLHVALSTLMIFSGLAGAQENVVWPLALVASLMGSCVFLPDQERHRFRFFVEHNIPPRYVWWSRQLPWIITFTISTFMICLIWVPWESIASLWKTAQYAMSPWRDHYWDGYGYFHDFIPWVEFPPLAVALSCVPLAYAAGQWMSMLVRSGLLAGFFGVLLSVVLCSWIGLMYSMQVSFLWSVAPIFCVLLWATWLRSPDWVRENARWPARGRAACAVLIPALALLVVVPFYRVHQVPLLPPPAGFEPVSYPTVTPEAAATAEMYRRASDQYVEIGLDVEAEFAGRHPTRVETKWLEENAKPLALVLEASRRPTCSFGDPRTIDQQAVLRNKRGLYELVLASGRQLESEGRLDEALDRYFALLPTISHLAEELAPPWANVSLETVSALFRDLGYWAARKGQTAARIRAALQRVQAIDEGILQLDNCLKFDYILARRAAAGDAGAWMALYGKVKPDSDVMHRLLWVKLMPWEDNRAVKMLNIVADMAMERLQEMRTALSRGEPIVEFVAPGPYNDWNSIHDFEIKYNRFRWRNINAAENSKWLATSYNVWPNLGTTGRGAASMLAEFETRRRAAMIMIALEGYRLEQGRLPDSLDALTGPYFARVPLDPYSGEDFRYFPAGLPQPETELEAAQLNHIQLWKILSMVVPERPCIWCTGPRLMTETWTENKLTEEGQTAPDARKALYYVSRVESWPQQPLLSYSAWRQGFWFPIPDAP